jgi:hypothetical protein
MELRKLHRLNPTGKSSRAKLAKSAKERGVRRAKGAKKQNWVNLAAFASLRELLFVSDFVLRISDFTYLVCLAR